MTNVSVEGIRSGMNRLKARIPGPCVHRKNVCKIKKKVALWTCLIITPTGGGRSGEQSYQFSCLPVSYRMDMED